MTEHEQRAIALAQQQYVGPRGLRPEHAPHFAPVARPLPGYVYDWADPDTGRTGRCWLKKDGHTWAKAPGTTQAVILETHTMGRRLRH